MPRYIDADWITQKLEGWQYKLAEKYGWNDEYILCLAEVLMKLDDTPTADVEEVVRCRDCRYAEQDEIGRWYCRSLGCAVGNIDGSGYCADGERREDDRSMPV